MHTFTLTDKGTAIHKASGIEYQIFIGQNKLWFICSTESNIKKALSDIQQLAFCSCNKLKKILSKYQIFWSGNAVIKSNNPSFQGLPRYDVLEICRSYCENITTDN